MMLNEEDDFENDGDYIDEDDEDYSDVLENSQSQMSLKGVRQSGQNKKSLSNNFENKKSAQKVPL